MKTLKIVQLIVWLLIITFLVVVLILFALGRVNFASFIKTEKQVELLQQTEDMKGISGITFDLYSADVVIKPSASDEISINYRGPESLKDDPDLTVTVNDGQLTIKQKETPQMFFFWVWSSTPRILEITLPESYSDDLIFGNTSGDLTISGDYQLSSFRTHLTSGDMSLGDISSTDFSIDSTSGNVDLGSIDAEDINISLTSGQIKAKALNGDGSIGTISGDIRIDSLTGNTRISATSGDITVSSLTGAGSVACTSGDIRVNVTGSLGDLSIKTSSGGVDVSLEKDTSYNIDANCTNGDVSANFPLIYSNGKNNATGQSGSGASNQLTIRTMAGDINLAA